MLLDQAVRAYPGSGSASASFFMTGHGPASRSIGFAAPTRSLYNRTEMEHERTWEEDDLEAKSELRPTLKVDTQVSRARGSMLRTDSAASGARLLYHGQSDLQLEPGTSSTAPSPASAMEIYGIACESQSGPIGFALPDVDVGPTRTRTPSWAGRRLV
ncbi:hypothetical protein AURDEDRAFT_111658 [Auricularia subglabra TFB-10046 SS5]|nr:hypothetical protein AURDEDRAFT_111658 [Auricularia subglabra TFB-10046 SS5]